MPTGTKGYVICTKQFPKVIKVWAGGGIDSVGDTGN